MKIPKKQKEIRKKINSEKKYALADAMALVLQGATRKFDETVDVCVRLGIDAKKSDQGIRGSVVLPHGLGKKVRVLALVKGEKETEAKEAGADFVGNTDMIEKIQGGWLDFDSVVATPDMMGVVSKVGKILGPRGLMPNPKLGTVSFDVKKAIQDCKAGKVEFRNEKAGNVHAPFGKISFGAEKLTDNLKVLLETIRKMKPATSKGVYLKNITLSSTMGPGVAVDVNEVSKVAG
ncbi:MAG: 50S ribosomal protein L1 [uncultured bacterium]|nr:MAG: 50S ribosomal protein L1 [uncultured bacterium]HLD44493.1 50S ribosomal protein L1 [bacterium]